MKPISKRADKPARPVFDKYDYYSKSVQSTETDVVFLRDVYKECRGVAPESMREDFCGTYALSADWIRLSPKHTGVGVDLDPEPLEYGHAHILPKLSPAQRERLKIMRGNVLDPNLPKVDLVAAMNFSYFIFKNRGQMLGYFKNVHRTLNEDGVFVQDLFGGSLCYDANEEKTKHKGFTYYWDQKSYDPATNYAQFAIHFKVDGERKREDVFTYDWRMWSIPELKEILKEAGFRRTHLYWEGTTKAGGGDGKFKRVEHGESCQSWIAYLVSEK
ncbi:MAG: class I SAM-dependent methyltransferase [Bdellovibrionaceae bacterium]|nr:class I SAM-dependent methyltransferase [Pseudobdellovibrionaceae bacterium]